MNYVISSTYVYDPISGIEIWPICYVNRKKMECLRDKIEEQKELPKLFVKLVGEAFSAIDWEVLAPEAVTEAAWWLDEN